MSLIFLSLALMFESEEFISEFYIPTCLIITYGQRNVPKKNIILHYYNFLYAVSVQERKKNQ